jgi:phytoene dehydrogenase-like protein
MSKYDAIIIGAGIGGLTCALLLAKKGVRVAVFEKEKLPGGYCSSFSKDGYVFDACVDSIGGLRKNEPLRHIMEEDLGIWNEVDFYELNPIHRNLFPGMSIDIPADINQYKDTLKSIFVSEKKGIDETFFLMEEIYTSSVEIMCDTAAGGRLLEFIDKSFYDLLSSFISDVKLKAVLSSYCTFLGLPAHEASAIALSNILMHYVKGGAFRVRGGIQGLSNALASALKNYGGELFLGEEVTRILSHGRSVTGIVTKSGHKANAAHIVSNIDLKTVLMLIEGQVVEQKRAEKIKELEVSGSFVLVYLGVKDSLRGYGLTSSTGYFSSYDLNGMLNKNEHIFFGLSFPSLFDSSVAPKGCSSLVIHWPFCYNESRPEILKDKIGKTLIGHLCKVIPSIADQIAYKSVAGPETLQRYTGNTFGSAYGWKQDAIFLKNLPFLKNLANNFHLAGHWAGYGGGVMSSVLSAYRVAKDIIKEEG